MVFLSKKIKTQAFSIKYAPVGVTIGTLVVGIFLRTICCWICAVGNAVVDISVVGIFVVGPFVECASGGAQIPKLCSKLQWKLHYKICYNFYVKSYCNLHYKFHCQLHCKFCTNSQTVITYQRWFLEF